jgi:hypothetical protein
MKHLFFSLIFVVLNLTIAGQDILTVVALKGLNIRSAPELNSTVIKSLPFGAQVDVIDRYLNKRDTINKVKGTWIGIKYQNVKGFAFSPYLVSDLTIERATRDAEMIILKEGVPSYATTYEPDFYYYGLYEINDSLVWEKVNVSFLVAAVEGYDKFYTDDDCLSDFAHVKISTDREHRSVILIGSRGLLKEQKLLTLFSGKFTGYSSNPDFIFPERVISLDHNEIRYNFRAYDSISVDYATKTIEKHYQIEFYTGYKSMFDKDNRQNISSALELFGSGERHSSYNTPILRWAGDINGDGILDVIFYQHGMVDHGGTFWQHVLFLGKKVGKNIILQKESSYIIGSCH